MENGYTIQLKQADDGRTFYDIHRTATAANPLDTAAGTVTVEFDLNIQSLTSIAGGRIGQYWSSEGVVIWVSDNSGKQLVYSVYYGKDNKLYFSYCQGPHGANIGTPICLDKTLKEKLARKLPAITQKNWQIMPLHVEFEGARVL